MGSSSLSFTSAFVLFSFFLFSPPLAFLSAEEDYSHCAPFICGTLTNISYPFSNKSDCGLSIIRCVDDSRPMIELGQKEYEVTAISGDNKTIRIRDHDFIKLLQKNKCGDLYNVTKPYSPVLSFEVKSPNLTFSICKGDPHSSTPENFNVHGVLDCGDRVLFFYDINFMPSSDFGPDCQVVQFPVHDLHPLRNGNWRHDVLFSLLNDGFDLQWSLPRECQPCESNGTFCIRDAAQDFRCVVFKKGREFNSRKLIAGISGGVGGIILTCLLFFFYRRKQTIRQNKSKNISPSSTLLSENISSYTSSKMDLEKGSRYFGVPIFSYEELVEATDNFNPSKELGDGGFGTVYHGKLRDGRVVAVKRLYENNYKRVEQFMNEVEILTRLRHQNLVTLYGCTSRRSRELLLVYEYIPNGTVADHLHGEGAKAGLLTWPFRMSIAIETAEALAYLHASDIIHRDIKTNNILLDNNFRVKVADFGLSRLFPMDVTHVSTAPQGTPGYVDPEYHQCYQLTDRSDVYSFGVVLIELISSKPAVDINRHRHEINLANMAINKIQNRSLHELIDPCLWFDSDCAVRRRTTLVAELAFRCLQQERDMRPSMDEVLEVLRGIENEDYKVEKTEEADIPADDVGLLKSIPPPLSPDSVTDKWGSRSTTPNASS